MNYPRYPDAKRPTTFQEGLDFEDFVVEVFQRELGVSLQLYRTKQEQYAKGETRQGFEIKLDSGWTQSNRLSIEIAEKTRASQREFRPSGIYRRDNTIWYVQGNYRGLFVFGVKLLRLLHRTGRYEEAVWPHLGPTVKKFYLPIDDANKYADHFMDLQIRAIRPEAEPTIQLIEGPDNNLHMDI